MWIISDTIFVAKCSVKVHNAFVMHEHFTQWYAFDKKWNVMSISGSVQAHTGSVILPNILYSISTLHQLQTKFKERWETIFTIKNGNGKTLIIFNETELLLCIDNAEYIIFKYIQLRLYSLPT